MAQMVIGMHMPFWAFVLVTCAGALATLVAIFLAQRGIQTAEEAALAATKNQRKAMQDVLVPLVHHLGEIVSKSTKAERAPLQQQMKQAIVTLAAQLIGSDDTRACLLEPVPGSSAPKRELKCLNGLWGGRSEAPMTVYREDEPLGKELFAMMDARKDTFVPDVHRLPTAFRPVGEGYRTYIAVTVTAAGNDASGVLYVDAMCPGDLSPEDVPLVAVLARLLGAALAVRR
ncbi:hypothetical protein SCATT_32740 [Streptantibioticus cattleyicolor NRRL 8057 = DSM 46488]|uniref:GAF domain-containing protein n=1 Tax=Streptantibioticus cattleyicolor (strain ATCC 35852 / DSM 46488 / JCM 4925 / NBRC 14057 / NRRL 8057) TaxID=1003195 RepID=G8X2Q4_STREN|nr:hypothetical protein SCATT_32740 [Streptantibioticus cattleyicolor NRRL 8057 = DSM 46488]